MAKEELVGITEISDKEVKHRIKPRLRKALSIAWSMVLVVMVMFSITTVVVDVVFDQVSVEGSSMYPTLNNFDSIENGSHDYVEFGLMNGKSKALASLKRGDIVVYDRNYDPESRADLVIKRLIALPHETILISDKLPSDEVKITTIDNEEIILNETYLSLANHTTTASGTYAVGTPLTLGDDQYFFMGDNRGSSGDCRKTGPVPFEQILGKLVVIQGYGLLTYNDKTNSNELTNKHYYNVFNWRYYA